MFRKTISLFILLIFCCVSVIPAEAQSLFSSSLNPSSVLISRDSVQSLNLSGMKIFPNDPFRFDFLLTKDESNLSFPRRRESTGYNGRYDQNMDPRLHGDDNIEAMKLIKYFLASLTIPENDLWVNLSPDEPERIIPHAFGQTRMGQEMLLQDYFLKKLTASLMNPEGETGRKFWDRIYSRIYSDKVIRGKSDRDRANITSITDHSSTIEKLPELLNKIWIVPKSAKIFQKDEYVFITEAKMTVRSDTDHAVFNEMILPIIEQEIYYGETFAELRQIYHALVLSTWYKKNLKQSLLSQVLVDQKKVDDLSGYRHSEFDSESRKVFDGSENDVETSRGSDLAGGSLDPRVKPEDDNRIEGIYQNYLDLFKSGVSDVIREEYDPVNQKIVTRKYFSGGVDYASMSEGIEQKNDFGELAQKFNGGAQALSFQLNPVLKDQASLSFDSLVVAHNLFIKKVKESLPKTKKLLDEKWFQTFQVALEGRDSYTDYVFKNLDEMNWKSLLIEQMYEMYLSQNELNPFWKKYFKVMNRNQNDFYYEFLLKKLVSIFPFAADYRNYKNSLMNHFKKWNIPYPVFLSMKQYVQKNSTSKEEAKQIFQIILDIQFFKMLIPLGWIVHEDINLKGRVQALLNEINRKQSTKNLPSLNFVEKWYDLVWVSVSEILDFEYSKESAQEEYDFYRYFMHKIYQYPSSKFQVFDLIYKVVLNNLRHLFDLRADRLTDNFKMTEYNNELDYLQLLHGLNYIHRIYGFLNRKAENRSLNPLEQHIREKSAQLIIVAMQWHPYVFLNVQSSKHSLDVALKNYGANAYYKVSGVEEEGFLIQLYQSFLKVNAKYLLKDIYQYKDDLEKFSDYYWKFPNEQLSGIFQSFSENSTSEALQILVNSLKVPISETFLLSNLKNPEHPINQYGFLKNRRQMSNPKDVWSLGKIKKELKKYLDPAMLTESDSMTTNDIAYGSDYPDLVLKDQASLVINALLRWFFSFGSKQPNLPPEHQNLSDRYQALTSKLVPNDDTFSGVNFSELYSNFNRLLKYRSKIENLLIKHFGQKSEEYLYYYEGRVNHYELFNLKHLSVEFSNFFGDLDQKLFRLAIKAGFRHELGASQTFANHFYRQIIQDQKSGDDITDQVQQMVNFYFYDMLLLLSLQVWQGDAQENLKYLQKLLDRLNRTKGIWKTFETAESLIAFSTAEESRVQDKRLYQIYDRSLRNVFRLKPKSQSLIFQQLAMMNIRHLRSLEVSQNYEGDKVDVLTIIYAMTRLLIEYQNLKYVKNSKFKNRRRQVEMILSLFGFDSQTFSDPVKLKSLIQNPSQTNHESTNSLVDLYLELIKANKKSLLEDFRVIAKKDYLYNPNHLNELFPFTTVHNKIKYLIDEIYDPSPDISPFLFSEISNVTVQRLNEFIMPGISPRLKVYPLTLEHFTKRVKLDNTDQMFEQAIQGLESFEFDSASLNVDAGFETVTLNQQLETFFNIVLTHLKTNNTLPSLFDLEDPNQYKMLEMTTEFYDYLNSLGLIKNDDEYSWRLKDQRSESLIKILSQILEEVNFQSPRFGSYYFYDYFKNIKNDANRLDRAKYSFSDLPDDFNEFSGAGKKWFLFISVLFESDDLIYPLFDSNEGLLSSQILDAVELKYNEFKRDRLSGFLTDSFVLGSFLEKSNYKIQWRYKYFLHSDLKRNRTVSQVRNILKQILLTKEIFTIERFSSDFFLDYFEDVQSDSTIDLTPGGIDFDPAQLNLDVEGDVIKMQIPVQYQHLDPAMIQGFEPILLNIVPFHLSEAFPENEIPPSESQKISCLFPFHFRKLC